MTNKPRWWTTLNGWRPSVLFNALDLALADPPLLCCDDDELCPACQAESHPMVA